MTRANGIAMCRMDHATVDGRTLQHLALRAEELSHHAVVCLPSSKMALPRGPESAQKPTDQEKIENVVGFPLQWGSLQSVDKTLRPQTLLAKVLYGM